MVIEYSTETLIILPVPEKAKRTKNVKILAHKTQTFDLDRYLKARH